MKTSTFKKRTAKANSGTSGKEIALNLLTGKTTYSWDKKVRTCWTSGSGRFTKNMDYTEDTLNVLHHAGLKQNVDFTLNNDSPRGGKTGNYLVLTSKGKRKMIKD
jgi:hypothetical protein